MSKYIKISQQNSPEKEKNSKPEMSEIDQANLQKLKSMKGGLTIQSVMTELARISRSQQSEDKKEAEATKYLQSIASKLTPMAQFLNTIGVKIPRN